MADKTLAQVLRENGMTGQDYPKHAEDLNAPTVIPNPVTVAPQVPMPISMLHVFEAIKAAKPTDLAKAMAIPDWIAQDAKAAMAANDRLGMANYLETIGYGAGLAPESIAALTALLGRTIPDPTWTATVAGPSIAAAAGLGVVTAADVQAADQLTGGAGQYGNG